MAERIDADIRAFMVTRLAVYESPSQVAAAVLEEFGVKVERAYVQQQDPERAAGRNLHSDLKALYYATREKFIADCSAIPIAQKSYRLASLMAMHKKCAEKGNYALASSLLEQAAKEMGEAYTNRQKLEHTSPDGSMTPTTIARVVVDPKNDGA